MITTSQTKLEHPRPEDGTLRDLDPQRRAARLRAAGVEIQRSGRWAHVVRLPDGGRERRRTFAGAERLAHTFIERRPGS
jgi:hypothetical protein